MKWRTVARRGRRAWCASALLLLAWSSALRAQDHSVARDTIAVNPGERVRLTLRGAGARVEGMLVRQTFDTLIVERDVPYGADAAAGADTVIATRDVSAAERRAGHRARHAGGGFGRGLLIGVPVALFVVSPEMSRCEHGPPPHDMCFAAVIGAPFIVLGSGLVGLVNGLRHLVDGWVPMQ